MKKTITTILILTSISISVQAQHARMRDIPYEAILENKKFEAKQKEKAQGVNIIIDDMKNNIQTHIEWLLKDVDNDYISVNTAEYYYYYIKQQKAYINKLEEIFKNK